MTKREELRRKRQEAARRQQLTVLGGVVALVAVVIGVIVWQNNQPVGEVNVPEGIQTYQQANGKSLGPADARVVIENFSDFQCPVCGRFAAEIEPRLKADYIEAGASVRIDFKHFIVIDGNVGGNESRRTAEASECAADQNLFWPFHTLVFNNQSGEGRGALRDARLKAFAEQVPGLDVARFNTCFDTSQFGQRVGNDEAEARARGLRGTPSVFVNGEQVPNPFLYDELQRIINTALGQ